MAANTIRFESRAVIRRPVEVVFDRLADLPGYDRWMHRTGLFRRSGSTSQEPVGKGTTYVDKTWMGTFDGEVTEFTPPTRIAFRETVRWFGSARFEARPAYTLDADGDATVVHHVAVGELHGWMRMMKPMAAVLAIWERRRTLSSLRRSLEQK